MRLAILLAFFLIASVMSVVKNRVLSVIIILLRPRIYPFIKGIKSES